MHFLLRHCRQAFATVVLGAALAWSHVAIAQEATDRSVAKAAGAAVLDAATAAWHSTQELSSYALGLLGVRYKFGGSSPETGLDCSGLVQYVFQQVTGVTLPRTAKEMSRMGDHVNVEDLQPGDLVFFNTRRFAFSHVGIYLGENQFIHSPRRGREVEVTTIDKRYWQKRFNGARRLVGVLPDMLPTLVSEATAAPVAPAPSPSPAD
jgi:cell wall-associated NlpC family hydrolase